MLLIPSIPKRYEEGFKSFVSISDNEFEELKKGLEDISLTSSIDSLAKGISINPKLQSLDISGILESVGSLISYVDDEDEIPVIAEDIITLLDRDNIIEIKPERKQLLIDNLAFILGNKKIFTAYKSYDLLNNYGNKFIECRIVSDIRPVFNINVEEDPESAMVVHNLQIHYQPNEEPYHKDISIVLDSLGFFLLKEAIDRAELKQASLKNIIDKSGMKNLNE
jgi:hypothetical protein